MTSGGGGWGTPADEPTHVELPAATTMRRPDEDREAAFREAERAANEASEPDAAPIAEAPEAFDGNVPEGHVGLVLPREVAKTTTLSLRSLGAELREAAANTGSEGHRKVLTTKAERLEQAALALSSVLLRDDLS